MNDIVDFIALVHRQFGSFAERHGMGEVQRSDTMAYRNVLFVGSGSYVRFSLDVRDGYLEGRYGEASNLDAYGNVDPTLPPPAWQGSTTELMEMDGATAPPDGEELYWSGRLAQAVQTMIASLENHDSVVFGRGR